MSGLPQVVVVDVGGTTTDVGVLLNGLMPRPSSLTATVGGARTSFQVGRL